MNDASDQPAWFCVHTKAQQENWAEEQLRRQEIEVYLPRIRLRKTSGRRIVEAIRPMFPGYLFARFVYARDLRPVTYTLGVRRVVSFGSNPTPVDDTIIEEIRRHEDENGLVVIRPVRLSPGEPVMITEGPFRGLEAIFEAELPDHKRVAILLHEIAFRARVVVDRTWVRPA